MIVLERVFVQMSDRRFLKCSVGKTDKGASCLNQFHPERIGQVYNYRLGDKVLVSFDPDSINTVESGLNHCNLSLKKTKQRTPPSPPKKIKLKFQISQVEFFSIKALDDYHYAKSNILQINIKILFYKSMN